MADNSILTPGCTEQDNVQVASPEYLLKDNYLSEYSSEDDKSIVRENLEVYPKSSVYTKEEADSEIKETVNNAVKNHLLASDPHSILPQVETLITDMVKTDGSTPFTLPQSGVDPQKDAHLVTKKYADKLIYTHLSSEDPHKILPQVAALLLKYVLSTDVYKKNEVYTKQETEDLGKQYVKRDGSTPFTKAQLGIDPTVDSHLATKRYIDKVLYNHLIDSDPHQFITILNNRLAYYIKKQDVYDKTQTYSKTQLDSIINRVTIDAVNSRVQDFMDQVIEEYESVKKQGYVKSDGSIAFINPQYGVDAVEDQHLVTLKQLKDIRDTLQKNINDTEPIWITSGPVEVEVGMVEKSTEFPEIVSLQEILDAIFYGKSVSISVPEYTTITETCPITLCIHGSLSLVESIEVYQGEELIYTLVKENFEDGCITLQSKQIFEDTNFTFKVSYSNGAVHEDTATTKVTMPIFVGLLPKWKPAHTITMDYLKQLEQEDADGTQNRFLTYGNDLTSITFKYVFTDPQLRHPFVVMPADYPDLEKMTTDVQKFEIEAFETIDMIPLHIEGVEDDVIYKIYVYKQALSSMNQEVTFNFSNQ